MKPALIALFASLLSTTSAQAAAPPDLCTIDGKLAKFERTKKVGGEYSLNFEAKVDEESFLLFHFNGAYGIGATVELVAPNRRYVLLSWASDYSESKLYDRIEHNGHQIECDIRK